MFFYLGWSDVHPFLDSMPMKQFICSEGFRVSREFRFAMCGVTGIEQEVARFIKAQRMAKIPCAFDTSLIMTAYSSLANASFQ
jgi:hypothetical protein